MKEGAEPCLCHVLVIADVRKPMCQRKRFYSEPDHSINKLDLTPPCLMVVLASQDANCTFNRDGCYLSLSYVAC